MNHAPGNRDQSDDSAFVEAVKQNRTELFAALVDRYLDEVRTFAAFRTTSSERADEAVRAAFVDAFHHLEYWDSATPFAQWLQALAAKHFDRAPTQTPRTQTVFDELDHAIAPVSPDAHLRARLLQQIARLPQPIHLFLKLRYSEDRSVDQISDRVNQSRGWVGTTLFRARQALSTDLHGLSQ